MAFVPMVLTMPENMFTAHAIAAISTLSKVLPCPTSAMDAIYRATLKHNRRDLIQDMNTTYLKFAETPVNTIAME